MEEFQAQCVMKVNDRTVDFGPRQFETGYVLCQHVLLIAGSLGNILFPPATEGPRVDCSILPYR